jgi:hypothetical protein
VKTTRSDFLKLKKKEQKQIQLMSSLSPTTADLDLQKLNYFFKILSLRVYFICTEKMENKKFEGKVNNFSCVHLNRKQSMIFFPII